MDVPLFPAPPSRGNITTPVSDVSDVATVTRIPASIVWRVRGRHAVAEPARERSSCVKKRCRIRRRSVHPRAVFNEDAARRRITEFRVRMTERRAKHDERDDDDDVVCGDVGLLWLLVIWTVAGAAAFSATEGPREREQVVSLKNMQRDLAVGLATELRQLRTEQDQDVEPLWSDKVRQYVAKHEELLLIAVSSGYGEGGKSGRLWTFPGCVLFAISLITTLGFGAPVPRTTAGRTVGVIFAVVGIPAHFLLVLNFGLMIAVRLQRYANARRMQSQQCDEETSYSTPMPRWVKIIPFIFSAAYYIMGILCFGIARSRPFAASVLFPLDFTAAGGLSTIVGYVRILYGLYLEGAVIIAAIVVAVLRVSATQNLTHIGLKYGLLIEA